MKASIRKLIHEELKFMLTEQKKWDIESIRNVAKKFKDKTTFARQESGAYNAAKKLGVFDEVTIHMVPKQIRWTKEMIRSEALKYRTKADFTKNSPKAADRARYYGIWDDVTKHMDVLGDRFKRMVYVYEFPDKVAYIGLTHDKEERDYSHRISGRIADYISKTGLQPELKVVSDNYIDARDAQNLENCTIEVYKNNGWKILNKTKGGSLGMCKVMWTKERVEKEVSKFENFSDFRRESKFAYNAAIRNNWLDDLTKNLKRDIIKWTKESILQLSLNYDNVTDFIKNEPKAYQSAKRSGWLDDVTKNMKKRNVWTDESLKTEMSKFKDLKDFRNTNNSAYVTAVTKFGSDFVNDFYGSKSKIKWTEDLLKKEASKYRTRLDFLRGSLSAYKAAERKGILQDLIKDMEPEFKWDIDSVSKEALKYKTRMDFKKANSTAYKYAVKWGLLDNLIPSLR